MRPLQLATSCSRHSTPLLATQKAQQRAAELLGAKQVDERVQGAVEAGEEGGQAVGQAEALPGPAAHVGVVVA